MTAITTRQELSRLLVIAAPLVAAYVAEYMMFVTTKLVVGDLGFRHLAAVGLAGSTAWEMLVILMGILSIAGVLAAQAEGAGDPRAAGNAARQGMIVAVIIGVPMTALIWRLDIPLGWTGQDPEVLDLARDYLAWLAPTALPALMFATLRNFVAALSRTRSVMAIMVAAVALNYVLTVGLVFGRWGLPEMGIAGAGLATAIANWAILIALTATIYLTPSLRGYGLFRGRLRLDTAVIGEFFRLGPPVAGLVAVEAGLFMAVGVMSGVIGAETLAAHQVLMGWIGFPFMFGLAIAEAAMVRVAFHIGRGSARDAQRGGLVAMGFGVALLTLMVAAPLLLAEEITNIFISDEDPGFAAVSAIVVRLMLIASAFQVFDGLQVIAARALRGVKDAYAPLWIGAFGYWVLGIGVGWLLAFPLGMDGPGLWLGLSLGIFSSALMLTARFVAMTRRMIRQAPAAKAG